MFWPWCFIIAAAEELIGNLHFSSQAMVVYQERLENQGFTRLTLLLIRTWCYDSGQIISLKSSHCFYTQTDI